MASGSKGFDFGPDDILFSYEDYAHNNNNNHDSSNGTHNDTSKDFHKPRMARTSIFPTIASFDGSLDQDVTATVERTMKKYADNIMRFLEGISSRLSQLELYCYNLDKSIGEMRSDLNSDHGEADSKLISLEKHVQEVHRSVQILRDKQELAEAQKELAKLQLVQKESSSSSHSQSNEERSSPSGMHPKRTDHTASGTHNQQLALALPHQITSQPQPLAPPAQTPAANVSPATQQSPYYMPLTPSPTPAVVTQPPQLPQNQYLTCDPQYRTPQPTSSQANQSPALQQFSQYQQPQQQQWPQQVQPPQPPSMQPQMRPPSTNVYTPYLPSQATNPSPAETLPNSMPKQMPYSGIPPPRYGYGGTGRTTVPQQPPPQQIKGDAYGTSGTNAALAPASGYMMYDGEGGRTHLPPQPGYPQTSASLQNPAAHNVMVRNPSQSQFIRGHPSSDLIEKLVSMGFRGDHVATVIQRMQESGQPIDFNSVLDRLNLHTSVAPQRGWSG